jgi:MFS family permease
MYYQQYVFGAVSTLTAADLGMSFGFVVAVLAVCNLLGAFGSLVAGVVDRLGRADVVVYGMLVLGVVIALGMPLVFDPWSYLMASCVVGILEGMLLVAAPALIRDFSPQSGRAKAMSMWVLGPSLGSLLASGIAASTLWIFDSWQSQFVIAGVIGLIVGIAAWFRLGELSPALREQAAVSEEDRTLLEARASAGKVDLEAKHVWRRTLTPSIVGPAVGYSLMLLFYYTVVTLAPIMFGTAFQMDATAANAVVSVSWAVNVAAAVGAGFLVDRFMVRKPWILGGALVCLIFQALLLVQVGAGVGLVVVGLVMSGLGLGWSVFQVGWFAAFTETIERRDPALLAPGLAIWAWVLRVVVTASFLVVPLVVAEANAVLAGAGDLGLAHSQWRVWMAMGMVGGLIFVATIPLLSGRWTVGGARADVAAHERARATELAALHAALSDR